MYWLRRSYATEGEKVVVLALTACLFSSVVNLAEAKHHTSSRTDLVDTDTRAIMGLERTETKSQTRKNTRRRHKHKNRKQRNRIPLLKEIDPSLLSNLVRFSPTRPHSPPYPYPVPFTDEKEESVLKLAVETKNVLNEMSSNKTDTHLERQRRSASNAAKRKNKNKNRNRRKRSKRRDMSVPVCQSTSRWVKRTEAEDLWGNKVKVAQHISSGGTMINQYFYETFCRRQEPAPCFGIDSEKFDSLCENKYIWTYARIINRFDEEGWNLIKIRGSCNCALFRKEGSRRGLLSYLN